MKYNLSEIFDFAIQIEKAGNKFYKKAAQNFNEFSDFFTFLANEEVKHDVTFTNIKNEVISVDANNDVWDPDGIINMYIESLTSSSIFKNNEDLDLLFKGVENINQVIDWAIKREHDTILFFIGLKSTFKDEKDKLVIERIISEEINHVHILMNKKSELL